MTHPLDQAIVVHNSWKARLYSAIQGGAIINEASVRADNACELGKWIHSAESAHIRNIPEFVDLESKHVQFHLAAAAVVNLVSRGEITKALKELDSGNYARVSIEVIKAIEVLKAKLALSGKA